MLLNLILKFLNRLIGHHGCAFGYLVADLGGLCPVDRVGDDLLHVPVVVGGAGLVTGLEIKYLARTARVAEIHIRNFGKCVDVGYIRS